MVFAVFLWKRKKLWRTLTWVKTHRPGGIPTRSTLHPRWRWGRAKHGQGESNFEAWRPHFGGLWKSPGTILMISDGIENCLEFHWIPWSGWPAPESRVPCQARVKVHSVGPITTRNQIAEPETRLLKAVRYEIYNLKTYKLGRIVRNVVKHHRMIAKYVPSKSFSSQPGGPARGPADLRINISKHYLCYCYIHSDSGDCDQ